MVLKTISTKARTLLSKHRASISVSPSLASHRCALLMSQALQKKSPYLVGRMGWLEAYACGQFLTEKTTTPTVQERLELHAGVFPATHEQSQVFVDTYLEAITHADMLGLIKAPFEGWVLKKYAPQAHRVALTDLEPYFSETPWSEHLQGLKVLVIHPFAESIVRQYTTVRERIFTHPNMLPTFTLKVMKAPQTIAGNPREHTSWLETLRSLEKKVQQEDFEVALIACGAYGLPLAATVKKMGKVAFHLGGMMQLLFGIVGERWRNFFPQYRSIMTDAWTSPLENERPVNWEKIENGCYW